MADTITTTGTSVTGYPPACGSRLPCGLCLITNRPCPMQTTFTSPWDTTPVPTWELNEVTCTTEAKDD